MYCFFINKLIGIELKFLRIYIGDTLKNVVAILLIAKVTINIIYINNDEYIIQIMKLIFNNIFFIIIALIIFYIIDKVVIDKSLNNYLKYAIILSNIYFYGARVLEKDLQIIILSGLILGICRLEEYIQSIDNKYENLKESISKNRYRCYSIIGFILLYSSINSLKSKSGYELAIVTICFYVGIAIYHKKLKIKITNAEKISQINDKEIELKEDLFETRKKELDYILAYFRDKKNKIYEPFAISISGKWGEGKTSFTNVLKEELKSDYIVFDIQPMITDTREGLIKHFARILENQFIQQGLDIGEDNTIDNYFNSIFSLIDSKGIINKEIFSKNNNSSKLDLREKKQNLQDDIDILIEKSKKQILVVVDDFDRVDNDVRYSILTFVKEIVNFNGVKTIILLDYSIIENSGEKITYEFLEKFINKRFELSRLSAQEVLEYYENINYEYKAQDTSCNFEIKIDNILKELKLNIFEIIEKLDGNIKKCKESIEQSRYKNKPDELKEVDKKKDELKKIESLKTTIMSGIENTRKLKRIIREIQDKIHYIKYIYEEFDDYQKESLIENIDVEKIVTAMSLIKVLYEKEYDIILNSKDFNKYLKQFNNLEVYELIYSTIFDDSYKLFHSYGIDELDIRKIDFINNIYICINTPKEMFEFRTNEQVLIDIISKSEISFGNEKTVYENIKNVYDNVQYSNIKVQFKNISEYISKELANGNIELHNSIQLIKTGSSFHGIVKNNRKYIKTLRNILKENYINYPDTSNRDIDKYMIKKCKQEIINSNKPYIATILAYKSINIGGNKYRVFLDELQDKESIEDINEYVNEFFDNIIVSESLPELDKLLSWSKVEKEYNDLINYNKINQRIDEMVDILDDLEAIENSIEYSIIEDYKFRDSYMGVKPEEVVDDLKKINEILKRNNLNEDQRYNVLEGFQRIVYRLSDFTLNEKIIKDNIEILDDTYKYMYHNLEFKKLNEEIEWNVLYLDILNIKKNQAELAVI